MNNQIDFSRDFCKQESRLFQQLKAPFFTNNQYMFVGNLLEQAYRLFSNRTALITTNGTMNYKELYFRSLLTTAYLKKIGLTPGERVLLYYENSIEFYIAYFAVWQCNAVIVPVNTFLHTKELELIVDDAKPFVIISSPLFIQNISDYTKTITAVISEEIFDFITPVPQEIPESMIHRIIQHEDTLCALLYTSGTTGTPKGVMLSSKNILTNALQIHVRFTQYGIKDMERFFCVLPLFHVFAQNTCLWFPIMIGASIIIISKIDRKLILDGLVHKPTIFLGFPSLYALLCMIKTAPLDSVNVFISGADMLPDKVQTAFNMIYGKQILSGYGLSEASPVVAVNHTHDQRAANVVGQLLTGISATICDDAKNELDFGSIGTLWIKGDNIMLGYYNAISPTQNTLVDGWLNTGDLASIDEHGNIAICGRSKDIIIHKGFNIYPVEIENILLLHPAVTKAAVVGHQEDIHGQIPIAFVALKENSSHTEAELRILCTQHLASYKVPRQFVCLDELPINSTGKIDKKRLQKTLSS